MRNPARLAAALSGRPLLLREAAVPALARMMGMEEQERGSAVSTFFGRARRALALRGDADAPRTEPEARAPRWVGEPDALGYGWVLKDGVGILEIEGPLLAEGCGWGDTWYHGYDSLRVAYEEMFADARVGAIWELVRSPGGVVDSGLPELAALKRENRAAAGGKPIHAFLRDGYSAAYWEPSAADHIDAARESGVGSIGAVVTWCGMAGAFEKEGFEVRSFKFGARKTDGSPYEPLSATAEASLQAEIDQCGRWFVADVLAGRANLTEEAVLATEAGCFFGDSDNPELSGLARGLIDTVRTERDSFAAVRELAQARLAGGSAPSPAPKAALAATEAAPAEQQETDMKRSAVIAAAKKAGLDEEQLTKLSAELPEDDKQDEVEDDDEDEKAKGEKDDEKARDESEDTPEGEDEASRISNSKEAKAHPALALAAIGSKATYAQFRAMAGAAPAPSSATRGRLSEAMTGAKRLGSDAGKSQGGLAAAMKARAEKNRGVAAN